MPSFELIELLQERGAVVSYCDPYLPMARRGSRHDLGLASASCTAEEIAKDDAVVVSIPHSQFKDPNLHARVALAVDTRTARSQRATAY